MSPEVSVVMSVYNGADRLEASIASVLAQEGAALELVIVDDGSTDGSAAIIDRHAAADPRVRVIRQDNRGLTRALARGCREARGEFIARQDCGDRYLPGRLCVPLAVLRESPGAAMVSCGSRVVGPAGEFLYDTLPDPEGATESLLALDLERVRGPSAHGSVTFRRSTYEQAGGYREAFYFAQDLDLWTRLVEHGRHVAIRDVLFEMSIHESSISGAHRARQLEMARLILECARLRRAGRDESPALERAKAIRPEGGRRSASERAAFNYFVGVCLQKQGARGARRYFMQALRQNPLHLKSAARLLMGLAR